MPPPLPARLTESFKTLLAAHEEAAAARVQAQLAEQTTAVADVLQDAQVRVVMHSLDQALGVSSGKGAAQPSEAGAAAGGAAGGAAAQGNGGGIVDDANMMQAGTEVETSSGTGFHHHTAP